MLMLGMAVSRVLCTAAGGARASSLMCLVSLPLTRRNDGRLGQRSRRRSGTVQAPNTDWKRRAYSMVMRHLSSSPVSTVTCARQTGMPDHSSMRLSLSSGCRTHSARLGELDLA